MANSNSNVRCINYYDLCRICTDSSDQNTNVFSAEGRAKNLSCKIYECLSLQIDEKDRLPKVVCGQCVQQVEQIHALRHTCKKTQTMLNDCLNIPPMQNPSEKLYIKDAIDDTGKSLSVVSSSPANSSSSQSNNLLSSFIQAVGMQSQQQFTITVDNSIPQQQQQQQKQAPPSPVQQKSDKQTVLEEFIRLKPDIKITPLGKRDHSSAPVAAVPSTPQQQTHSRRLCKAQTMRTMAAPQMQLQPMLSEQSIWQQIQQLQQLTSQLAATTQFSASEDGTSPSESKKPKLNFVLSAPAGPQFTTSLPQFVGAQPQLQLQLMPVGGSPTAAGGQTQLNATALLSSLSSPQTGTSGGAGNILSPSKCFLPITIRDENSDQQIVAHIDTKNLVLPTTYQVQMKLQPQLATADGQPIMELTPTSIPATLQLTPQTLGNANNFQGATTAVASAGQFQNIFLAPQPPQQQQQQQPQQQPPHNFQQQKHPKLAASTATVTSQQIIRSPQSNLMTPQLFIRNVPAVSTMAKTVKDEPTFKIPSPKQRQMQPQQTQQQPVNPKVNTSPTSSPVSQQPSPVRSPELRRVGAQGKPLQSVDNIPPTTTTSNPAALQRLSSSTTITKVAKPQPVPAPPNMPLLNKQNITISRIPTQTVTQTTPPKPSIPASTAAPPPATAMPKPALAPPPTQTPSIAVQHKKIMMESQEKQAPKPKIPRPPQPICPAPGKSPAAPPPGLTCPKCNREFKKREHLVQHIKLHAGLRPYKCSEEGCDKAFSRKEHLSRHLISHSGKKLFNCEACHKPFSRKDNLSKHMRIHTHPPNETLFCCDVCNKNFATKLHYEKHREMHKKPPRTAPASTVTSSTPVRTNGQAPAKDVTFEIEQQTSQQQQQKQTPNQPHQAQIMHVVTTQDHAGNTITITQAPDSNMPSSLANYVQLGFPNFTNPPANQLVCKK
ncbi:LOW QUALITY PROTEIN: proline-rich protein 36 [Drosophila obscura]|uniref:LOW QUALITY PROTEIN: proline-rich protein 36 n=1 Tax=Drosophila obscura TaxID=7282 RepID=UPI001BB1FC10|nr:LOW QUALITY PROTEIN: proline-rich protein 36 [Drosophila obscura]